MFAADGPVPPLARFRRQSPRVAIRRARDRSNAARSARPPSNWDGRATGCRRLASRLDTAGPPAVQARCDGDSATAARPASARLSATSRLPLPSSSGGGCDARPRSSGASPSTSTIRCRCSIEAARPPSIWLRFCCVMPSTGERRLAEPRGQPVCAQRIAGFVIMQGRCWAGTRKPFLGSSIDRRPERWRVSA